MKNWNRKTWRWIQHTCEVNYYTQGETHFNRIISVLLGPLNMFKEYLKESFISWSNLLNSTHCWIFSIVSLFSNYYIWIWHEDYTFIHWENYYIFGDRLYTKECTINYLPFPRCYDIIIYTINILVNKNAMFPFENNTVQYNVISIPTSRNCFNIVQKSVDRKLLTLP